MSLSRNIILITFTANKAFYFNI